jgi:uncharacterized protein YkwD
MIKIMLRLNPLNKAAVLFLLIIPFLLAFSVGTARNDALKIHNDARAEVGQSDLQWSGKLEREAKRYANLLARRDKGLKHDLKSKDGENLYMEYGYSNDNYLGRASEAWLSERDEYTYDRVSWSNMNTGHYTQMIWSSTQHVGIAYAISKSGTVYVVARYSPAGNIIGVYPY